MAVRLAAGRAGRRFEGVYCAEGCIRTRSRRAHKVGARRHAHESLFSCSPPGIALTSCPVVGSSTTGLMPKKGSPALPALAWRGEGVRERGGTA